MSGSGSGEWQFTFTVFTPTWNRERTLPRVFESLRCQTFRDFEWLIVDDGSVDGTARLAGNWQTGADFPIRYLVQEHQGKPAAFRLAVREARGELFLTLDSDDECVPNALERFKFHWDQIPESRRREFSAVTALVVDPDGNLVGDRLPRAVLDSDSLELFYRWRVRGEKWGFQRTDVLRQYPPPVAHGDSFVPEGIVWGAIAKQYRTRYVNEALRVYWQAAVPSSTLTSESPMRHAAGLALWHQTVLNEHGSWFRYAPEEFLRSAVHFVRFSFDAKVRVRTQLRRLQGPRARALWFVALLAGWLLHERDKWLTGT